MNSEEKTVLSKLWTSLAVIKMVLNCPLDVEKLNEAIENLDETFNVAKSFDPGHGPVSEVISRVENFRIDLHEIYFTELQLTDLLYAIWEIIG